MDFDWGDLGKTIIGLGAPILGTALGGPLGGVAGKLVADALGTDPTPAAVNAAIAADPAAAEKLADAEVEWAKTAAVYAQSAAQQAGTIGETQRAEIAAGQPWWHWRNLQAYELFCFECPAAFTGALYTVGSDLIKNDFMGVTTFTALATAVILPYLYARLALLGYVAQDSTKLRNTAMTGEHAPTLLGQIVGTLVKKK